MPAGGDGVRGAGNAAFLDLSVWRLSQDGLATATQPPDRPPPASLLCVSSVTAPGSSRAGRNAQVSKRNLLPPELGQEATAPRLGPRGPHEGGHTQRARLAFSAVPRGAGFAESDPEAGLRGGPGIRQTRSLGAAGGTRRRRPGSLDVVSSASSTKTSLPGAFLEHLGPLKGCWPPKATRRPPRVVRTRGDRQPSPCVQAASKLEQNRIMKLTSPELPGSSLGRKLMNPKQDVGPSAFPAQRELPRGPQDGDGVARGGWGRAGVWGECEEPTSPLPYKVADTSPPATLSPDSGGATSPPSGGRRGWPQQVHTRAPRASEHLPLVSSLTCGPLDHLQFPATIPSSELTGPRCENVITLQRRPGLGRGDGGEVPGSKSRREVVEPGPLCDVVPAHRRSGAGRPLLQGTHPALSPPGQQLSTGPRARGFHGAGGAAAGSGQVPPRKLTLSCLLGEAAASGRWHPGSRVEEEATRQEASREGRRVRRVAGREFPADNEEGTSWTEPGSGCHQVWEEYVCDPTRKDVGISLGKREDEAAGADLGLGSAGRAVSVRRAGRAQRPQRDPDVSGERGRPGTLTSVPGPSRLSGAPPVTLLHGWVPAMCPLSGGRPGAGAERTGLRLLVPADIGDPVPQVSLPWMAREVGRHGAGLGLRVRPPHSPLADRPPWVSVRPGGAPAAVLEAPSPPGPRFPRSPGQASPSAPSPGIRHRARGPRATAPARGELANSAPRWPPSPLPPQAAFPAPPQGGRHGDPSVPVRPACSRGWLPSPAPVGPVISPSGPTAAAPGLPLSVSASRGGPAVPGVSPKGVSPGLMDGFREGFLEEAAPG
ncbi:collagen alpha-1(I) chain-like [Hippopotamus amphibius kiboko]|uniref:collagen alpha-1(I) chain-like n=1 Tax=Hippopotamus amphibius kiboko TaxID=575201 RepID=UPI00259A5F27|nr:collagen alpha-1(I) chain-like [Hippopotamus amphibius kiboko]